MRRVLTLIVCLTTGAWAKGGGAHGNGRCVVAGKSIDPIVVDVTPKEAAPFKVRIAEVAAAAMPEPEGQPARVEVMGPLAFEGTAPPESVPWKTARVVDAKNGMVRLAAGTEGLTLHATAFARVVDAEVQLGPVRLKGLQLPCAGLTLDPVKAQDVKSVPEDSGASFVAAEKLLHFRAGAGSGSQIEVQLGDDLTALDLHQIESANGWMRVSSHWLDGTTLVGWVKKEQLKRASPRHEPLGEAFAVPATCSRELTTRPGEHVAKARVTAGTQVFAARYVGPWATVKTSGPLTVRWLGKDDWVSIVGVQGIVSAGECPEHSTVLDEAWVPRQSVQLPPAPSPAP